MSTAFPRVRDPTMSVLLAFWRNLYACDIFFDPNSVKAPAALAAPPAAAQITDPPPPPALPNRATLPLGMLPRSGEERLAITPAALLRDPGVLLGEKGVLLRDEPPPPTPTPEAPAPTLTAA